jgi:hypothetical protein
MQNWILSFKYFSPTISFTNLSLSLSLSLTFSLSYYFCIDFLSPLTLVLLEGEGRMEEEDPDP